MDTWEFARMNENVSTQVHTVQPPLYSTYSTIVSPNTPSIISSPPYTGTDQYGTDAAAHGKTGIGARRRPYPGIDYGHTQSQSKNVPHYQTGEESAPPPGQPLESTSLPWQEERQHCGELNSPGRSNSQYIKALRESFLDINSELTHYELDLKLNPSQQLNEYAKNIHNIYRALHQYDPELADSIL